MRQIVVDYARRRRAQKRGGGEEPLSIRESSLGKDEANVDVLDLHRALEALTSRSERLYERGHDDSVRYVHSEESSYPERES